MTFLFLASNFRNQASLSHYLKAHNILGIADIDTRKLTRILRDKGAQNGCLMAGDNLDENKALELARAFPGLSGMDLADKFQCKESYQWTEGSWTLGRALPNTDNSAFHVVAYDFGVKRNILRMLADRGCRLTVVPAQTPAEEVLALNPDGIFLSNGPGDPAPCDYAIKAIETFLTTDIPVFGICLGHQLLALASGAKTIKMTVGHHGGNHPVKNLDTNKVLITAQNHGFSVEEATYLPIYVRLTSRCLMVLCRAFTAPTNQPLASRATLKPVLVHTKPVNCLTTLSN